MKLKDKIKLTWLGVSMLAIMLAAEGPMWLIVLLAINLTSAAIVANRINI